MFYIGWLRKSHRKETLMGYICIYSICSKFLKKHVTLVKTDKDDQIWLCISGDILSSNEPTCLCLSYNSPIGSSRETQDIDLNIVDRILKSIVSFAEKSNNRCQFLICTVCQLSRFC